MRVAIISDIHANLKSFQECIKYLESHSIDEIICLGDVIGYYSKPNECLELIKEYDITTAIGNHDAVAIGLSELCNPSRHALETIIWTKENLCSKSKEIISRFYPFIIRKEFIAFHGSFFSIHEYIRTLEEAYENVLEIMKHYPNIRICFFGHTHRKAVYEYSNKKIKEITGRIITLRDDSVYLINPGSIGQPRDGRRSSFLIFDSLKNRIQFFSFKSNYEIFFQKIVNIYNGFFR